MIHQRRVKQIVTDVAHDADMVDNLLSFRASVDFAIDHAFLDSVEQLPGVPSPANSQVSNGPLSNTEAGPSTIPSTPNQEYIYALSDAFSSAFKARPKKPAELLAKAIDKALRKGQREMGDVEFSESLDKLLRLYRFSQDKDVFRAFYHRMLAKRLLLERSASDDVEKKLLRKLTKGAHRSSLFPNRIARLINDTWAQSTTQSSAWATICLRI